VLTEQIATDAAQLWAVAHILLNGLSIASLLTITDAKVKRDNKFLEPPFATLNPIIISYIKKEIQCWI
jgi:hypothetical protein